MRSLVKPLSLITTIGMFVVVVMGATVTNTGSATGCGRSWPLCNGQLIPEFAVSTLIEFSHRAVTGVETMLVLATAIGAWFYYRQHREVRILAPLMVGTLFLQAIMGAWAGALSPGCAGPRPPLRHLPRRVREHTPGLRFSGRSGREFSASRSGGPARLCSARLVQRGLLTRRRLPGRVHADTAAWTWPAPTGRSATGRSFPPSPTASPSSWRTASPRSA